MASRQPYFGDLHVHTRLSLDAGTTDSPRDAYLHARTRARPLDFAATTDHAEWLGEVAICTDPSHPEYDSDVCWYYNQSRLPAITMLAEKTRARGRYGFCGRGGAICLEAARSAWQQTLAAAQESLDTTRQCEFTSFVAYEWTGTPGAGINLHRNVIFAGHEVPTVPASYVDAPSARALWDWLDAECIEADGACDAMVIPHNSNLSDGLMFASAELETPEQVDLPISRAEAIRRRRLEPLVEIIQHKGASECLYGADTRDEACRFESLPYRSFAGAASTPDAWPSMRPTGAGMVRSALKRGLLLAERLGVNPFEFGFIGSTDTHIARPGAVEEVGYAGHTTTNRGVMKGALADVVQYNPGGLVVAWAEENSRASIFAALRRRETYATSGPRIVARFFGGWELGSDLCGREAFAARAYDGGVPMGSRLEAHQTGAVESPTFVVHALQDAGVEGSPGTPLREIEIVKGWVEDGVARERVHSIARAKHEAQVDERTCQRSGHGATTLCGTWRDPDFDPDEPAFYYARVLEDPSCRWSQLVCVERGVDCAKPETIGPGLAPCCSPVHRPTIQERAWTSPIWYSPPD